MASIPGGPADKLGNEFERLWTVRHILDVLAEAATTIAIEPLGLDERGTEFWVTRPAGTREAHQCKRENGTAGEWSAAALESKSVLSNAKAQLDRDPSHRFFFVSSDKAPLLSDLAERAKTYDDPRVFVEQAVNKYAKHRAELENLCRYLSLDPTTDDGRLRVADFLRRFTPVQKEKSLLRAEVEEYAARWVTGDPATSVVLLERLASEGVGKELGTSDIVAFLHKHGRQPQDLAQDVRLEPALRELRERYDRSFRYLLINGRALQRAETGSLLALLREEAGPRLILVHGDGGDGKSGVVFEAANALSEEGTAVLPLRLDQDKPADTPHRYGEELGLPASPAVSLAASASGRKAVLLIDQMDAIRWTIAHSSYAWDTCERVIEQALRHPSLRVVVVCRSFDLNDDRRIKAWRDRHKVHELKVGRLEDATIDMVLREGGVEPSAISKEQREILRSPQSLYLWSILGGEQSLRPTFRSSVDLMRGFWDWVRRRFAELDVKDLDVAVKTLVDLMDARGTLHVPRSALSAFPKQVDALLSLNVIREDHQKTLLFSHQSYLDYLTAERMLHEVQLGTRDVSQWLQKDEQSLFRRGQLRQLLTLLRDDATGLHAEVVLDLVTSPGLRFHLQHLALQVLGFAAAPSSSEVELVLALLEMDELREHVALQVLIGQIGWFDALEKCGALARWLSGNDQFRANLATAMMERSVKARGGKVFELIVSQTARPRRELFESILWRYEPAEMEEKLFRVYVTLAKRGSKAISYINWDALAKASPERCFRLMSAVIGRDLARLARGGVKRDREDPNHLQMEEVRKSLVAATAAAPDQCWERLMPCLACMDEARGEWTRKMRRRKSSVSFYSRLEGLRPWMRIVSALLSVAGKMIAERDGANLWRTVAEYESRRLKAINRVLAASMEKLNESHSDRVIMWLCDDAGRLRSGRCRGLRHQARAYRVSARLIKRFAALCAEDAFSRLEGVVLNYRPKWEKDDFEHLHHVFMGTSISGEASRGLLFPRDYLMSQFLLLSAMPEARLKPASISLKGVLQRKFGSAAQLMSERQKPLRWTDRPLIPKDRLRFLSDAHWLDIVEEKWTRRRAAQSGGRRRLTPELFAGSLRVAARQQPQRFADLALRFDGQTRVTYVKAVLQSVADSKAPAGDEAIEGWIAATGKQIDAVVDRFKEHSNDRDVADVICRAVRERASEEWDATLPVLAELAERHPHPAAGEFTINRRRKAEDGSFEEVPDLLATAINCVRGEAAGAIESLLYFHLPKVGELTNAIESLVNDPHPAVRVAATGVPVPLLNGDRAAATSLFLAACDFEDDAVLESHDVGRFLRHALLDQLDRVKSLLERMATSANATVCNRGAAWTTAAWLHLGSLSDEVERYFVGTEPQRRGVIEMVVLEIPRGRGTPRAFEMLVSAFNDDLESVRDAAASIFRDQSVFSQVAGLELASAFVRSKAFENNVQDLLAGFKDLTIPLRPYAAVISSVVEKFTGPLVAEARDLRTRRPLDAGTLADILLRLYEQSESDKAVRSVCLDAWDRLLRERVGFDVLQRIDRL